MAKQRTKAQQAEKESSLIISRVQREAREGTGDTRNTIIRSRVIHGDAAVEGATAKPTRKKATAKRAPRPSRKRTHADTTHTPTET